MEVGEWSISSPASKFLLGALSEKLFTDGFIRCVFLPISLGVSWLLLSPGTPVF